MDIVSEPGRGAVVYGEVFVPVSEVLRMSNGRPLKMWLGLSPAEAEGALRHFRNGVTTGNVRFSQSVN